MSAGTRTPRRSRPGAQVSARKGRISATRRTHPPAAGRSLWGIAGGLTLAQYARLLTGFLWLGWADSALAVSGAAYLPLFSTVVAAAGLAAMGMAVSLTGERAQSRLDTFLLVGSVLIIALSGAGTVTNGSFTSDEIALNQGAASTLLHGANPFTADLSWVMNKYGISGGSFTLDGGMVTYQTYPALSFLLYAPAVAVFGTASYASVFVNLLCWSVTAALLWKLVNTSVRPWIPLFIALPVLFIPSLGDSDPLYIPFMLLAVCCWDRFGDPGERSPARWIGPIALGLACAVKPTPWLVAPFLVAGVGLEARRRAGTWRTVLLRYVSLATVAFLVPNLPFIALDPGAWGRAVLAPITSNLIPTGVGPVALLNGYGIGGGNLSYYTIAAAGALLSTLLLFVCWYPHLKRALPALPFAALFLSTRPAAFYFAFCLPALAISAASVRPAHESAAASSYRTHLLKAAGMAGAVASVLAVALALVTPAPLKLDVLQTHADATAFTTNVRVANVSAHPVSPHFLLVQGVKVRDWLQVVDGPERLQAGETALYHLSVPASTLTPHAGELFQVNATSADPTSLSASASSQVPAEP